MRTTRLFAALLALGCAAAAATGAVFTWIGGTNSIWTQSGNWDPRGFPDDSGDTADINLDTNGPVKFSTGTYTVGTFTINADMNSAPLSLEVTGGSLATAEGISIKGDQDGSASATLKVTGGTFAPYAIEFIGRNDTTDGHAVGDFDVSVTLGSTAKSIGIVGYADLDIASNQTLQASVVGVGDSFSPAVLQIGIGSSPGTGTFACTTLNIDVGDTGGDSATVLHRSGTLAVSGKIRLKGSGSVDAKPTLKVLSTAWTSVAALNLDGGSTSARAAYLELHESVDLTGTSTTGVTRFAQAQIDSDKTLSPNTLQLGDGTVNANFELLSTSGNTGEISATKLIIKGGSDAASKLTVSGGKVVTE